MIPEIKSVFDFDIRRNSRLDLVIRRFKSNKLGMLGLGITIVFFVVALIGPIIVPYDPTAIDAANIYSSPSAKHWFGTDSYGRDVFSRVIVGARISLKVASIVVLISTVIGVTLGLYAGYYEGIIDEIIMRTSDILFAFPFLLLALIVIAILGPGINKAILALSIAYIPLMIRVTRGSAISIRGEEYVMAAKAYGESDIGVMFRNILPNLISAVMVQATMTFAFSILAEAALSYIGLSAQPPTPTWGVLISAGQNSMETAPWNSIFPGLAIMITVLGLTFLGVGLRDALDPKTDIDTERVGGQL